MKKLSKVLSFILKNFLIFLTGGVLGLLSVLIFAEPLLEHSIKKDVGFGVIAVAPLLLVLYGILFWLGGGILAVAVYHLIRSFAKRKRKQG